jgi:hypothetical protein
VIVLAVCFQLFRRALLSLAIKNSNNQGFVDSRARHRFLRSEIQAHSSSAFIFSITKL